MKIPPICGRGSIGLVSSTKKSIKSYTDNSMIKPLKNDSVSFSSNSKYLRKYVTLPQEIKQELQPSDAIDMFKYMEDVAQELSKDKSETKPEATIETNPWLDDYLILVSSDPNQTYQEVYSTVKLGDCVWADAKNPEIQLVKKVA